MQQGPSITAVAPNHCNMLRQELFTLWWAVTYPASAGEVFTRPIPQCHNSHCNSLKMQTCSHIAPTFPGHANAVFLFCAFVSRWGKSEVSGKVSHPGSGSSWQPRQPGPAKPPDHYRVAARQENLGGLRINYPNVLNPGSDSQLQKVSQKHLQATHRPTGQKKTRVYKESGPKVRQEFTYLWCGGHFGFQLIDWCVQSVFCTDEIFDCPWMSTICKNLIANKICLRQSFREMQWFVRFQPLALLKVANVILGWNFLGPWGLGCFWKDTLQKKWNVHPTT